MTRAGVSSNSTTARRARYTRQPPAAVTGHLRLRLTR